MADSILIVEDEVMLREAYQTLLTARGYKVFTAADGKEALQVLKKHTPRLILLDMMMPVMNGLEFMKAINLKAKYPDTTVILLSNFTTSDQINDALKLGVTQHVVKADTTPDQLVKLVSEHV